MTSVQSVLLAQPPPADLAFGCGGLEFFSPAEVQAEQAGYEAPDWNESWLVIGRDTACGDPIFVNCAAPALPVLTAMHGMGSWEPSPIALSWASFVAAVEAIRPFTVGREHPVGLEGNPLSESEQASLWVALESALGISPPSFWGLLLEQGEP